MTNKVKSKQLAILIRQFETMQAKAECTLLTQEHTDTGRGHLRGYALAMSQAIEYLSEVRDSKRVVDARDEWFEGV